MYRDPSSFTLFSLRPETGDGGCAMDGMSPVMSTSEADRFPLISPVSSVATSTAAVGQNRRASPVFSLTIWSKRLPESTVVLCCRCFPISAAAR